MEKKTTPFEYFCLVLILGGLLAAFVGSFISPPLGCIGAGSLFLGIGLFIYIQEAQGMGLLFVVIGAGLIVCSILWLLGDSILDTEQLIDFVVPILLILLFGIFGGIMVGHALKIWTGEQYGTLYQFLMCAIFGTILVIICVVLVVGIITGRLIPYAVE